MWVDGQSRMEPIFCLINAFYLFDASNFGQLNTGSSDFYAGISLADDSDDQNRPSLDDFSQSFSLVFVDQSGYLNLLATMASSTYELVSYSWLAVVTIRFKLFQM